MSKKNPTKDLPLSQTDAQIDKIPLGEFSESAYLNYSMYVILDRALPSITDGLKPVQRRIIFAMNELSLNHKSKFKKSARTIGDVLGKYHPHGDSACYEAMVMLAQDFSFNYTFVEGQGNWGTQDDPKSFAAMRYTESRLTEYSDLFLQDIEKNTVEWSQNFDGSLMEPKQLPAKIPNILINGSSGIAVGMSTDIPSHNLEEILDATVFLIEKPSSSINDLMKIVKGPDFPTRGEIIQEDSDISGIYSDGHGNIKLRATYSSEGKNIIIDSIPYQSHTTRIIEQIQEQISNKKAMFIDNVVDDSDQEHPIRIIIRIKGKSHDDNQIMSHLFATTDLEKTLRVNLNSIGTDNRPKVKNIKEILTEWINFRLISIKNKLLWELEKIQERIHILEAYVSVYKFLDKVIKLIRTEDNPKSKIKKLCKLSDKQYEAVINMKLRSLAKLQEKNILKELSELKSEEKKIAQIIKSKARLKTYLKNELKEINRNFSRPRMTSINSDNVVKANVIKAAVSIYDITAVLSTNGWIKFLRGHDNDLDSISFKTGDHFYHSVLLKSNHTLAFFDQHGFVYNMTPDNYLISRGNGEPLSKFFKLQDGTKMVGITNLDEKQSILNLSNNGYGFITVNDELNVKNKSGKKIMNLKTSIAIRPVSVNLDTDERYLIITSDNYMLIEELKHVPIMTRGKGIKLINIPKGSEETIKFLGILNFNQRLVFNFEKRKSKTMTYDELRHFFMSKSRRGKKIDKKFLLEKSKTAYNIE